MVFKYYLIENYAIKTPPKKNKTQKREGGQVNHTGTC